MDAYYAHSIKIYDTQQEENELRKISSIVKNIVNPKHIRWTGSMEPYFKAVKNSDLVFATEYKSFIGKGVFDEVKTALDVGIPVYTLRSGKVFKVRGVAINDPYDCKFKYGKINIYPGEVKINDKRIY